MTFSYNGPASSPVSAVRFTIGDTNAASPRLTDEEIEYLLVQTAGDVNAAARHAVESIIATLSNLCDQTVGSVSKSYSQMRDGWMATLGILKGRSTYRGGMPLAGGISRTAQRLQERDRDRLRPQFTARMMRREHGEGRPTHGLGPALAEPDEEG